MISEENLRDYVKTAFELGWVLSNGELEKRDIELKHFLEMFDKMRKGEL